MIKAVPEDFVVEERALLPLRSEGPFRVYLLRKRGWNTLDLIRCLSRTVGLAAEKISYGGKKDKHGLTSQFITIRDPRDFSLEGKGYSVESRGFMDRPMGPDLIRGNDFIATVRNLGASGSLEPALDEVQRTGFLNYFDDQRYRSYDPERGFFAEKILKRHWNGAVQVLFTSSREEAGGKERARKKALFKHWKDWRACLSLAEEPLEKEVFSYLVRHPAGFVQAIHRIPEEEVSMLYAAFQSHLWNELLRRLIKMKVKDVIKVPGREGGYIFWDKIDGDAFAYFQEIEIPTAAVKMDFPDVLTRSLHDKILKEKGLTSGAFRTRALRNVYFRSFRRKVLIIPQDLRVLTRGDDERHSGKKKLTLAFFLPRGSYATMLIKRLTLRDLRSGAVREASQT